MKAGNDLRSCVDILSGFEGDNAFIFLYKEIFLDSSMVEHSAVNRVVVGSSPTRGAV